MKLSWSFPIADHEARLPWRSAHDLTFLIGCQPKLAAMPIEKFLDFLDVATRHSAHQAYHYLAGVLARFALVERGTQNGQAIRMIGPPRLLKAKSARQHGLGGLPVVRMFAVRQCEECAVRFRQLDAAQVGHDAA